MQRLDGDADKLETATRNRIEAIARSLKYRGEDMVEAWRFMLSSLGAETPPEFVDWFSVDRIDGRDTDVGMHRHWTDPTVPFAEAVLRPSHGALITSATLTDGSGDNEMGLGNSRGADRCHSSTQYCRSGFGSVALQLCGANPGIRRERRPQG